MYWLISLLVLQTLLEGLLCHRGRELTAIVQRAVLIWAALLLTGVTIALCVIDWQVWIWSTPIVAYRLINLLRIYRNRLPQPRLRNAASSAFNWLLTGQVLVTLTAWAAVHFGWGEMLLNLTVVAQLLGALILLRAALHTWRHAGAPNDRTVTLSDRELPTVSVCVPARNETDDLQQCLDALVASDYPKLEILVLDDCSATPRTPEIIRSFAHTGVRFIQGGVPDESRWLAKNWAYEQLAREASGKVLLFCGVDAILEPHSIRQLVWLLEQRGKDMLSVMPLRQVRPGAGNAVLQAMRYYWEISLPRRFFKRPPVLSTCWMIRREALERMGGFESVSRTIHPEAPLARRAVITDAYSFIRSDSAMGIYSNKPGPEQYATSVRVRYPQLHRRLELVALAAVCELALLIGPFIGLAFAFAGLLPHALAYGAVWLVTLACLFTTYGLVVGGARLASEWLGWLWAPVAFVIDLVVLHVSLWEYEFDDVEWKGRNVCIPVMQVVPHLPKLPTTSNSA